VKTAASLLLVCWVAQACSGSDGESPFVSTVPLQTAGSRLQPRFLDGGDGARMLFDFFDRTLGTPCRFARTADGTYRCLPSTPAGCVIGPEYGCGEAAFSTGFELDACGQRVATGVGQAPPGSPSPNPLNDLLILGCSGDGTGHVADDVAIPLESFVSARLESVGVARGLAVQRLVADDGASVTIGFARDGQPCMPTPFGDGVRCLDESLAALTDPYETPNAFVGPSCAGERAAYCPVHCSAPRARLAVAPSGPGGCADSATYYLVGEDAPKVSYTNPSTLECIVVDESYDLDYGTFARLGSKISWTFLPGLDRRDIAGTGRLRVRTEVGGGAALGLRLEGTSANDFQFFDTELQTACTVQIGADGQPRCLPVAAPAAFSDNQCTELVLGKAADPCGSADDRRFLPRNDESRECGGGWAPTAVLERGEPYSGPVYLVGADGTCTMSSKVDGEWFLPGAVHPLTDFAVVSVTE